MPLASSQSSSHTSEGPGLQGLHEGCNLWESNEGCKERFANTRDAFYAGDCDSGTHALAKALGWDKDLELCMLKNGKIKRAWLH